MSSVAAFIHPAPDNFQQVRRPKLKKRKRKRKRKRNRNFGEKKVIPQDVPIAADIGELGLYSLKGYAKYTLDPPLADDTVRQSGDLRKKKIWKDAILHAQNDVQIIERDPVSSSEQYINISDQDEIDEKSPENCSGELAHEVFNLHATEDIVKQEPNAKIKKINTKYSRIAISVHEVSKITLHVFRRRLTESRQKKM